ncbi:MAG: methyltransferase type 11 [Methanohalophilus sp.]|nr:MAG: methyltransferase type 11 [Methanohalophilus sp.]
MNYWDKIYSKRINGLWYPREGVVKFVARFIKRRVGIDRYDMKSEANKVLDLGCGNGRHVVFFAEQGFEVSGIDISSEAIEIAKAWIKKKNLMADLKTADAEKIPYEDNSFDIVISDGVIDHVSFDKAMLIMNEVKRVLKPKGYVYIKLRSTEDSECGRGDIVGPNTYILANGYEKGIIQHFFDQNEIKKLFDGFTLLDLECNETKFSKNFSIDKAFLQSSNKCEEHLDFSSELEMCLKYSEWLVTAKMNS